METHSKIIISTPQLCPLVTSQLAFHWAQDGPAHFAINGKDVTVDFNDGIFINCNQIVLEKNRTLCLALETGYLTERIHWQSKLVDRVQEKQIQPYLVLHNDNPSEKAILDGLRILDSIRKSDTESYGYLSPGIIYSMFQALTERVDAICPLDFPQDDLVRCRDLMKYFAEHYKEKVVLPDVANIFEVTPNTCIKTFRKYIGITPIDYLNLYRMNEACKLLCSTKTKVGEIGEAVGIPDSSYFTASFRKILGMTPSKYRKQNTPLVG